MSIKEIDFSCKHNILIWNPENDSLLPMDEPYFESEKIAEGTWKIRTDGDAIYLVEGDNEAIVIDSGYGAVNLREYAQSLTDKPVKNIINTHDHFDHTANNAYFEKAYMTRATAELATIPFPSFEGIDFPRDYAKEIVKEGDIIDLGGRTLEVIELPDHAVGSIVLLDNREHILFAGDEIVSGFKKINNKVSVVLEQFKKLQKRIDEIDIIWPGPGGSCEPSIIDKYVETMEYIVAGGEPKEGFGTFGPHDEKTPPKVPAGTVVYERFRARFCDMKLKDEIDEDTKYVDKFGIKVVFDGNKI